MMEILSLEEFRIISGSELRYVNSLLCSSAHFEADVKLIVNCHRVVMQFHAGCETLVFWVVIVP